VWWLVLGPANIKEHATCPAQRLEILCHAINVAQKSSHVAIDVQDSVVKYVPKDIATSALINSQPELIYLR
jgi:hypothetical protein